MTVVRGHDHRTRSTEFTDGPNPPATQPIDAVLDRARGGDNDAFAVLYRDTQPRLVRYASVLVGQDADDVTAEAWLQIARDLPGFAGDISAFRGWAATVVRNRAFDLKRAVARRPSVPVETMLLDRAAENDTAGAAVEAMSTRAALALIATLPRDQAEAVLLRTVVGLDAATAGQVLGKRSGAVRVAAHRGLKALGKRLDATGSRGLPAIGPAAADGEV